MVPPPVPHIPSSGARAGPQIFCFLAGAASLRRRTRSTTAAAVIPSLASTAGDGVEPPSFGAGEFKEGSSGDLLFGTLKRNKL